MFGNPDITKTLDKFWSDNYSKQTSKWADFIDAYRFYLDLKLQELSEPHPSRDHVLGMSKAGGCTRRTQITKLAYAVDENLSGSTASTFFIGHMMEPMVLATLANVGCDIVGTQYSVTIEGVMESEADAAISWPEYNLDDALLSIKTAGYKKSGSRRLKDGSIKWERRGFPEFPFDGMLRSQPSHYAQAQAELLGAEKNRTLYVVVAKDMIKSMEGDPYMVDNGSLTFYTEIINFNADDASSIAAMAGQTIEGIDTETLGDGWYFNKQREWVKLNPRDADHNRRVANWDICSYCEVRDVCVRL